MPVYEYECRECGQRFERLVLRGASEAETGCPECRSVAVERIISASAVRSDGTRARSAADAKKRRAEHRTEVGASEHDPTHERHDDH